MSLKLVLNCLYILLFYKKSTFFARLNNCSFACGLFATNCTVALIRSDKCTPVWVN